MVLLELFINKREVRTTLAIIDPSLYYQDWAEPWSNWSLHSYIPFVKIIPFYLWNSLVFVDIPAASWLCFQLWTDSWMDAVDKGYYVGALLLDFTKAFDSVPHQLLPSY